VSTSVPKKISILIDRMGDGGDKTEKEKAF